MPTNKTQNYQLSQWVKSDQVRMEDFNADNAKLDAALAKKADIAAMAEIQDNLNSLISTGRFTVEEGEGNLIDLGFYPRLVILARLGSPRITFLTRTACYETGGSSSATLVSVTLQENGIKFPLSYATPPDTVDTTVNYFFIAFR